MTNPDQYLFWITSRAAGTTAMVLASVTVGYGLTMGGRLAPGPQARRRATHEVLSLSVMVAIAIHGLSLLGDAYLHPSLLDVVLPFRIGYRQLWTSIGIVSGWGFIALGLSYYARTRIGVGRWKLIHRFTLLAWIGGLVHCFTAGTDSGQVWFIALIAVTAAPAVALLGLRITGRKLPRRLTGERPLQIADEARRRDPAMAGVTAWR